VKFTINANKPVDDKILDAAGFETFLNQRIKVDGKLGNLGDKVKVSRDKGSFTISSQVPFSKRYLKYLTKKYLKNKQLRDYVRVVSEGQNGYVLKYFAIGEDEEGDE